jgi:hypothetical protein
MPMLTRLSHRVFTRVSRCKVFSTIDSIAGDVTKEKTSRDFLSPQLLPKSFLNISAKPTRQIFLDPFLRLEIIRAQVHHAFLQDVSHEDLDEAPHQNHDGMCGLGDLLAPVSLLPSGEARQQYLFDRDHFTIPSERYVQLGRHLYQHAYMNHNFYPEAFHAVAQTLHESTECS